MDKWQSQFLGLKRFPRELSDFEIQAFFTFTAEERIVIDGRRQSALKLGLALQIGFLRMTGHSMDAVRMVPRALLTHLSKTLGVVAPDLSSLRALYQRGSHADRTPTVGLLDIGISLVDRTSAALLVAGRAERTVLYR